MGNNLVEQIKALSNSKLGHTTALETFARCLHSVYGKCSFLSFEPDRESQGYLVRLKFSDTQWEHAQLDDLVGQAIPFYAEQLDTITANRLPVVEDMDSELCSSLLELGLPVQSMMAIPLYHDGEIGRWVLILGEKDNQFAEVDLEQAILLANLAGTYMVRIDEAQALANANAWIEKELDDIGRLQKLLLPQRGVTINGADTAVFFSSCAQAGGDYYDIVNLTELTPTVKQTDRYDAWGMIIADASGHGAAAAVEIAMFDAVLRTYSEDSDPGAANVFNYANEHFFTRIPRDSFITASIVGYLPETGTLFYANAGHPPTIVITPENKLEYLDEEGGIPLGVDPDWRWQDSEKKIDPGSVIISITDGILEAMSPERQQFGRQQLEQVLLDCHGSAQDYLDCIVNALQEHQAGCPQTDDQAVVVVRINE